VPVPGVVATRRVEAPASDDAPPRRLSRWVLLLSAALAGVLAGRFSKRDRE
jgi:hypothetical protein